LLLYFAKRAAAALAAHNTALIGGTGAGKTHLSIAIARACVRVGKRGRFYNTVDLVNKLEAEARAGSIQGQPWTPIWGQS
jgi:DNA replication protein DnaC